MAAGIAFPLVLHGQDRPLSLVGTFSTGYYATNTRIETNQSLNFVPVGAKFDLNGFFLSPDLATISVQPELTVGPQASEAGFEGGNGVRLRATFFRRLVPITFRYSNVQVEDVYFGSLTQISGYTLKDRTKDLGVTVELHPRNLPETIVDWGMDSVDSVPGIAGIPDYVSKGHHVNVDSKYQRSGWVFDAFFHDQFESSDLLAPIDGGTDYGSLKQTVLQYQGSARRTFLQDCEFFADGGSQSTSSLLFSFPIDLTTRYGSANLRLFQRRRWRTAMRAGYSSNLASQLLAQAAASLASAGSAVPDSQVLQPFSHGIENYLLHATTTVTIGYGFEIYGSFERSALVSDNAASALSASYVTGAAGLTYSKKFHWGSLAGEYERELGVGSITGQSGTIQGQTYRGSFQLGSISGWLVDLTVHGSNQSVHNAQPLTDDSFSTEGNVGHRVAGQFSAQVGGGWQWSSIVNNANEFRTNGYTARAGVQHPRFQATASINNSLSNSLPFYSQVLTGLGPEAILLVPSQIIPSDYRAMVFSLHTNPLPKIEISAQWTHSRQHLDGFLSNDFQLLNIYLTYHFRRLMLEAGYIRAIQVFADYPLTYRDRLYVRISRTAKIL